MIIVFRFATPDDADGILAIYAPYCESTYVSFEIVAPARAEMRERVGRVSAEYPWLVCEIDGEILGYVYASRHRERAAYRWTVDVAVYVSPQHHRRGIGRALYSALLELLRAQGFFKAYAGVTLPNASSVGLHEALGFTSIGVFRNEGNKFGQWRDVGWWELSLKPEIDDPPEPRPIAAIRSADWATKMLADAARTVR